jgi:hypothetical protein
MWPDCHIECSFYLIIWFTTEKTTICEHSPDSVVSSTPPKGEEGIGGNGQVAAEIWVVPQVHADTKTGAQV